jgi:hypothetical protein
MGSIVAVLRKYTQISATKENSRAQKAKREIRAKCCR